jgi:uncharacterized protein (TIGR00730 family)
MPRVCVFCGSSVGARPDYADAARRVGESLAKAGLGLVYGGGNIGLMGTVARAALAAGGEVIGVIPRALMQKELGLRECTELREVASMHERKQLMADLSDGFIALPGGLGTLEELAEVSSWAQLGLHRKPIGLLGPPGYWEALLSWLDHAVDEGFVSLANRALLRLDPDLEALLDRFGWRAA